MDKKPVIPIILLNWNRWSDTIACLHSLFVSENKNFCILIADNNSTDDSKIHMINWMEKNQKKIKLIEEGEVIDLLEPEFTYFIQLKANYGFAKANNLALASIYDCNFEDALLLNNDTEVSPDFLSKLINFKKKYPEYKAITPLICYFSKKDEVWNAGGKSFFGFHRYYYANQLVSKIKEKEKIDISFVTGCALFFHKSITENKKIFTERFFFGEEDFDFSLRMKKQRIKMACAIQSIIFHKVSSSTSHLNLKNRIYLHYLNRFINIKLSSNIFAYLIWKHVYLTYIIVLLGRKGFTIKEIFTFICRLYIESERYNEVNHDMFIKILETYKF